MSYAGDLLEQRQLRSCRAHRRLTRCSTDRIITTAHLDGIDQPELFAGSFTLTENLEERASTAGTHVTRFITASFHKGVRELADLQPDMVLEGVTTNVTRLGPFVDIGVPLDGLVHIQEVSYRQTNDLNEALGVRESLPPRPPRALPSMAELPTAQRPEYSQPNRTLDHLGHLPHANSRAIAASEPQGQLTTRSNR